MSSATLNENKVALGFVIDRSGSMNSMNPTEICGSLNNVIKDQVATDKEVLIWFSTFDDKYEMVHRNCNATNITITRDQIEPRGLTALYDAMKNTINTVGTDLAAMTDRPSKVIMVILTDGEENCSKNATQSEVMDMVKEQQEKYSWEFMFLGANQDAIGNGASLGIGRDASCDFDYSNLGCEAVLRTASNAINRTISGQTPRIEFTEEERMESQLIVPDVDSFYLTSLNDEDEDKDKDNQDDYVVRRTNGGNIVHFV